MKTYALLVGLNQYQDKGILTLGGCVNDINRFEQYLLSNLKVPQAQILKLLDDQAPKAKIIEGFQTHFANAKSDDVCIFYFAGHGVRQEANPVFKSDSLNDTLECMTCYDTKFDGTGLIADKEQRWLINQLATNSNGCHIVMLFDCCHSGDNTRAVGGDKEEKERMIRIGSDERGGGAMPQRAWKDFIFANNISEKMVADNTAANHKLDEIMPQRQHIQLAACGSNETAKERGGHGYFSTFLLELLESSNGKMTYYDLRSLIYRRLIDTLAPEKWQTPQFYAVESSLFQPFLGGAAQTSITAPVSFSTEKNRWEMGMGSIYGIYKGATVFVTLPHKNNQTEAATVEEVYHDCSVLSFAVENNEFEKQKPDAEKSIRRTDNYTALTGQFLQKALNVACVSSTIAANWAAYCEKSAASLESAQLKVVANSAQADYVLNTEGGQMFIARPNAPARPLVKMIADAGTDAAFEKIIQQLIAASRWEFVRTQKSDPAADTLLDYLSIDLTLKGKTDNLNKVEKVTCPITKYHDRRDLELNVWDELLSVKITNNHPTDTLYVAGIWESELFGIDPTILKDSSIALPIEPTKSVGAYGDSFNLLFGYNIFIDKWDKFYNYLKVYVSTHPFEITQMKQVDLEHPRKANRRGGDEEGERVVMKAEALVPKMPQWAVKTVEIEMDVSQLQK
jgi:Caspase domain